MKRAFILGVFLLLWSIPAIGETTVAEPEGYRLENFRAPVPAGLKGAKVATTAQVFEMWNAKSAVFVDAMARAPKPADLPKRTLWRDAPRSDIPGSIWLVNTGYGALSEPMQRYFEDGLAQATGQDKHKALVFYCLTECWMSWNAAKRAVSLGYDDVHWYPDGTDGWEKAGHPLEDKEPAPGFQ
jgi:PQQ-dependent catabolism-associated CXXCW motif protein